MFTLQKMHLIDNFSLWPGEYNQTSRFMHIVSAYNELAAAKSVGAYAAK